jgi:hypothetical protein
MGHSGNFSDLVQYETKPNYEEVIKKDGNITEKFITYSIGYDKTIEQNQKIRKVIGSLYYVLIENPQQYFSAFRSYNPFKGGDDEEKAVAWFETWFRKKFKTSLASRVNSVDMENIWEDLKNNKNNK